MLSVVTPRMELDSATTDRKVTEVKSGWADSMAKILGTNKPKKKKTLMLSRAKKDFEIRKKLEPSKTSVALPVVRITEDVNDDDVDTEELEAVPGKKPKIEEEVISVKAQRKLELQHRRQLREWENISRIKPDPTAPTEKTKERDMVKIATKGVVQLFNAVSLQQKALKNKLRGTQKSEFKKDKVLYQSKDMFDTAMVKSKRLGGSESGTEEDEDEDDEVKQESESSDEDFGDMQMQPTGSVTFSSRSISTTNGKGKSSTSTVTKKPVAKPKKKPGFKAIQDDYMTTDWNKDEDSDS